VPAGAWARPEEPSAQPGSERVRGHGVGERRLAVDLDDRQTLAIRGLERGVAADVDDLELERVLEPHSLHHLERAFAEVAARRVVDDDPGQG
jgi:hypothetical protein